ncbi:DUF4867 family protein [Paucilactobacillus suebicus]|uniref:DUF4867 domain-containing protein n=1 Tax=Paucilactobacillus suebicus DSM 5007 = KCTC 3549 TaxID=1423807 RepID=A0A0R1W1J7_9LACO|nr:DUF4867 family protein [Paucilactobacillus suebicus]KRM11761.1 hypothetical protein FD16_GL000550 [Paucilactobacillus suebicus DSM 5007 = KCTC 3549]
MTTLKSIQEANPSIEIKSVNDAEFALYGRVVDLPNQDLLEESLNTQTSIPDKKNQYVRDDPRLVDEATNEKIAREFYGEQEIEIGYCNGHSHQLNAFEYHNCSEINLAATDLILFMALQKDLAGQSINTDKAQAFFVPKGTAIEVYPMVMHFAPNQVTTDGFKCLVILTADTNTDLLGGRTNDEMLFQHNKWLITHKENERMVNNGALIGVIGDNTTITPVQEEVVR